jgi:hypothetical protein
LFVPVVNQKSPFGRWSCCVSLVVCIVVAGCGKKGPPLAPIVRIPAAVPSIQAHRVGSNAFVTLAVPNTNIDRSMPVDIVRIEIYGYTGRRPPPAARWVEFGELVASIPVIPPPPPPDAAPAPPVPVDPTKGALPGAMVTVLDRLTGPKLVQGKVEEAPVRGSRAPTPVVQTTAAEPDVLHRFYIATPFSARGRPGPPSPAADFALIDTPEPPAFVVAPYSETQVALQWPPSGGIIGFLFSPGLSPEDPPLNDLFEPIVQPPAAGTTPAVPTGPVRYNVYRDVEPDPFALPDPAAHLPWTEVAPTPINPAPLDAMTFADSVEFNRERCYSIRAVRGTPPNVIEGDASAPNCFFPVDFFPPAPPTRLVAVADEGGISLIWEPNAEPDVAGYLVLRGEPTDATLQPLTTAPVTEARFRDTHVSAGQKYVYAVIALDSRLPFANVSAESNRVEETAR